MLKNIFILLCFIFVVKTTQAQSINVLNNSFQTFNGSFSPIDLYYDYSYTQVIYRNADIQGSGVITALTYYFTGSSLNNSDSLLVYLGNTTWDEFDYYRPGAELVPVARMSNVFSGKMSYSSLPGNVTIALNTPFVYNSDSNLIVAICDLKVGNNAPPTPTLFVGYDGQYTGKNLIRCLRSFVDLNPMIPNYVETHTSQYLGGNGGIAKITLVGLTPFPCQSPQQIHFINITHNSAKVMWSPPPSTTPTAYDIYYSPNRSKPFKPTLPLATANAPDTQMLINSLLADTLYYVWVRSRCGSADTSVWTYMDSFHTICAPLPIPTVVEPFPNIAGSIDQAWLPHCWSYATGYLVANSQIIYVPVEYGNSSPPWRNREWRNQTGSTNFAEMGLLVGARQNWLISPSYDLGNSGNKSLEFDLALTKNGSTQQGTLDADDQFAVVISTDNGITWSSANTLQQWVAPQTISGTGQHVSISLSGYSGVVRIGFYAASSSSTILNNVFVDNFQITGVMPVTLLAFTGQKQDNNNLLTWRTATEQNNRGFELQRAAPSNSPQGGELSPFATIAFVPTKANGGNSTSELSYAYTDKNPPRRSRGAYYRLKQVDFDGKFTYSNVVFIKGEPATELALSALFPNPTHQLLNVVLEAPAGQKVQLLITDLAGKMVQQQTIYLQKGVNSKTMNVAALAKGTYIVKVVCADGCERAVRKFVKE